ncbi:sigma-70 family RNA polymerase sigma factor [Pirellulales bacterium]|nr:sigma-70 family RNA polymerase sigma factor [Pirellulales bacterium]
MGDGPGESASAIPKGGASMDDANLEQSVFVERLTEAQQPLFAYIATMLGGDSHLHDVLQDTNLDLWAKSKEYDPKQPFLRWAFRFAYLRVLVYRNAQARSKLLFSDEVLQAVEADYRQRTEKHSDRLVALEECLGRLSEAQRDLVRLKYEEQKSLKAIASVRRTTGEQLAARLYRIRHRLQRCIEFRLREATH